MECISVTSTRGEVIELIKAALAQIEVGGDADDCASWRLVDALVLLKSLNRGFDLPGIDDATGRGGKLGISSALTR